MTRFGCQTLPNSISGAEDQPEDQLLIVTITVKFTPQKFNVDTQNDALENVYI